MPDEIKPTTGDNAEKPTPEKPTPAPEPEGEGKAKVFDETYVKELRSENADWRKKYRDMEKRLSEVENAKQQETDKKLAEDQKWQELAAKREDEIKTLKAAQEAERLELLRVKVSLPYAARLPQVEGVTDPVGEFAGRLRGTNEEELKADAERLIALIRPPQTEAQQPAPTQSTGQTARRQTTTVAPDGQPSGETDEQKRNRLYGRQPIANPAIFRKPQP